MALRLSTLGVVAASVSMTGRDFWNTRQFGYLYLTTSEIETVASSMNRSDVSSMTQTYEVPRDPTTVTFDEADQVCLSNTLFAFVFSVVTFQIAMMVVIGLQTNVEKDSKLAYLRPPAEGAKKVTPDDDNTIQGPIPLAKHKDSAEVRKRKR